MFRIAKEKKIKSFTLLPFSLKINHLKHFSQINPVKQWGYMECAFIFLRTTSLLFFFGNEIQGTNADTSSRSTRASREQLEEDTS